MLQSMHLYDAGSGLVLLDEGTRTHWLRETRKFLFQIIFWLRQGWVLQLAGVGLTFRVWRPDERPSLFVYIISLVSILPFLSGGPATEEILQIMETGGYRTLGQSKINVSWDEFQHIREKRGVSVLGAGALSPRPFLDAPPRSTNNLA